MAAKSNNPISSIGLQEGAITTIEGVSGLFPPPVEEAPQDDVANLAALASIYGRKRSPIRSARITSAGKGTGSRADLSVLQLLNTIYDNDVLKMFIRAGQPKG